MSFWIELHCDMRKAGFGKDGVSHGCETLRGDNQGFMRRTKVGANTAMTDLQSDARKRGWKKTMEGWSCKFCAQPS